MSPAAHHLARLAEDALARHGDRDALWFEGRWHRAAELHDRVQRLAGGLRAFGIRPGDHVVIHLPNCPEVGLAYHALWRAGAVPTPAIFLLPPAELRHVITSAGAVAVITSPELLAGVRAAVDGAADPPRLLVSGGGDEGTVDLAELETADPAGITDRDDDDLAALLFTGGTTGRAKGVPLTHANLWWCAKGAAEGGHVDGVTRTIVPLPLAHAYGLVVSVAAAHVPEPGSSVLMRWFDPQAFLGLIAAHRVQRATVVPAMLSLLLAQPLEEHDLSSLRLVNCGSSALAVDVAREFERRVPSATVLEGYGCTESGGIAATNPPHARKLGTVGTALPGYELGVVDEDDQPLPPGELGEVVVRSRGVMSGYWHDPGATAAALREGWLHTGDLGTLDEDGYLTIRDRKKDLIIRGGFNVYPRDVEDALAEHPSVALAGVVGRPDPRYGEEVVAFVQLQPGATADGEELRDWAKERIGGYRYPREVVVVEQVPLTPVLKVDRKALRARL